MHICKKCNNQLEDSEKFCGHCGTEIIPNDIDKTKWNWEASFLAPWYYAKHGKWGWGLFLGFIYGSMIPLLVLIPFIYAGLRANHDLKNGEHQNKMKYMIWITLWVIFVAYAQIRTALGH